MLGADSLFGENLKWPFMELQIMAGQHWLYCSALKVAAWF